MSTLTRLVLSAVIVIFVLSSCRKYSGPVPNPYHHDTTCQVTALDVTGLYGPLHYAVTYNGHGNPISLLVAMDSLSPYAPGLNYYYRYDSLNRLTDQLVTGLHDTRVGYWQKYVYAQPDFIIDTAMTFNVEDPASLPDVSAPAPNAAQAYYYNIAGYTLDSYGRVIKGWNIPQDPSQPQTLAWTRSYDANGDRILSNPGYTYDNKINPYLTNRVWQFLFVDYSIHNAIRTDSSYTNVYNAYGLPVDMQNLADFNDFGYPFGINNLGLGIQITYACSMPKGPVGY